MLEPDFERLYDERDAFFLDPTGQRVVPDPRLPDHRRRAADRAGPADARRPVGPIAAGVRNPLTGVQLRNAVTITRPVGRRRPHRPRHRPRAGALGDLRPARVDPGAAELRPWRSASTASRWTSTASRRADPRGLGRLRPRRGAAGRGRPLPRPAAPCTRSPTASRRPGPAGTGAYGLTSAAVVGRPAHRQALASSPASGPTAGGRRPCSPAPTAGPRAGAHRRRRSARRRSPPPGRRPGWCATAPTWCGCRPAAQPQAVSAPTLPGPGPGRRPAALARRRPRRAGRGRARPARRCTSAPSSAPRTAAWSCGTCAAIAPSLSQVVDVAWRDSGNAARAGRRPAAGPVDPYAVGVDGWGLDDRADGGPAQPADVDRRRADPAAAGRRRRHDLAAGRRHLGDPGAAAPSRCPGRRPSTRCDQARRPQTSRARPRAPGRRAVGWRRDGRRGCSGALADLVLPRTCAGCGVPGADPVPGVRGAARRPRGLADPAAVPLGLPADGRRGRLQRPGAPRGQRVQGARPDRARRARSGRRSPSPSPRWCGAVPAPPGRCCSCRCRARRRRCAAAGATTCGS